MKTQPFYAVRIVIHHDDGSSSQRDYVRGEQHMGRDTFSKFALGDMISLVSDGTSPITWTIESIDFATVQENRRFHHTTH